MSYITGKSGNSFARALQKHSKSQQEEQESSLGGRSTSARFGARVLGTIARVLKEEEEVKVAKKARRKVGKRIGGGKGNKLGTSAAVTSNESLTETAQEEEEKVIPNVVVDENLPVTTIRIRRQKRSEVIRLNVHHTIGDLRNALRMIDGPDSMTAKRTWVFETTYPSKPLLDHSITIKDAGLLNALIVQRFTL